MISISEIRLISKVKIKKKLFFLLYGVYFVKKLFISISIIIKSAVRSFAAS